jgi:hypothetical protein
MPKTSAWQYLVGLISFGMSALQIAAHHFWRRRETGPPSVRCQLPKGILFLVEAAAVRAPLLCIIAICGPAWAARRSLPPPAVVF